MQLLYLITVCICKLNYIHICCIVHRGEVKYARTNVRIWQIITSAFTSNDCAWIFTVHTNKYANVKRSGWYWKGIRSSWWIIFKLSILIFTVETKWSILYIQCQTVGQSFIAGSLQYIWFLCFCYMTKSHYFLYKQKITTLRSNIVI